MKPGSRSDASCNDEVENRANGLPPGQMLILHSETYA